VGNSVARVKRTFMMSTLVNEAGRWDSEEATGEAVPYPNVFIDPAAQVRRSFLVPVSFLLPVFFAGISSVLGGMPALTDVAWVLLTAICLTLLLIEIFDFGRRQGIGAILIYGGVLVWFCHDYF